MTTELVLHLSENCNAVINVGDTLCIGGDQRHWRVIDVDGNEITLVLAAVH